MMDKDAEARKLAEAHYEVEPGMLHIFRIIADPGLEQRAEEPIKLLEVSESTIPSGIMPLLFDAIPSWGLHFPAIIVEITPQEFEKLQRQELKLPDGWTIGELYSRPVEPAVL